MSVPFALVLAGGGGEEVAEPGPAAPLSNRAIVLCAAATLWVAVCFGWAPTFLDRGADRAGSVSGPGTPRSGAAGCRAHFSGGGCPVTPTGAGPGLGGSPSAPRGVTR